MTSNQVKVSDHKSLLDLSLAANARLRIETSKLQVSLDDKDAGIQALLEHASRVENHAQHIERRVKSSFESSFSWRLTSPLRKLARTATKIKKH